MTGSVGCSTGPLDGLFTHIRRVSTEGALINGSVGIAIKRHSKVLKLIDHLGCLTAHKLNGILVTKIVRALYRIEHMPIPIVVAHIAQRGANPALGRHRVGARWEDLR